MIRALSRFLRPSLRPASPSKPPPRRTLSLERLECRANPSSAVFESAFAVGDSGEWARDIAADAAGNTYVTGLFNRTVNFNPAGASPVELTSDTYPNPNSPTGYSSLQQTFVAKYDNTGICLWAVKLSGSAEAVAVDPAHGGVLVTGYYQTGDSTFGAITLPISGEQDAYVVRLNEASGGVEWARSWGGQYGHDTGMDVAFDAAGNAYAAGRINLTAGNANINTDIYVVKYDLAGSPQWAKQFGGTLGDTATALKVGTDGNVLVGGSFRGSMDFDPGAGTYSLTSGGRSTQPSEAGFVMKLTGGNGSFVWASHFQANQNSGSSVADLATDQSGNVFAVGDFSGTVDFNPSKKVSYNATSNSGGQSGFAVKLSPQGTIGTLSWVKTFGGNSNFDVYGATVDSSGSLYITGSFRGTADFDPSSGVSSRTSAGEEDAFAMKLDTAGTFAWSASMGGTGLDRGQGIAVDISGNVYSVGMFGGQADFDPDPTTTYYLNGNPGYAMYWLKLNQA